MSRFSRTDVHDPRHGWVLGAQLVLCMLLGATCYYILWRTSGFGIPWEVISHVHVMLGIFTASSALMAAVYYFRTKQTAWQAILSGCLILESAILALPIAWGYFLRQPLPIHWPPF